MNQVRAEYEAELQALRNEFFSCQSERGRNVKPSHVRSHANVDMVNSNMPPPPAMSVTQAHSKRISNQTQSAPIGN